MTYWPVVATKINGQFPVSSLSYPNPSTHKSFTMTSRQSGSTGIVGSNSIATNSLKFLKRGMSRARRTTHPRNLERIHSWRSIPSTVEKRSWASDLPKGKIPRIDLMLRSSKVKKAHPPKDRSMMRTGLFTQMVTVAQYMHGIVLLKNKNTPTILNRKVIRQSEKDQHRKESNLMG